MKSSGFEGVVDMRPRRILSSYDPTIDVCCKGEESSTMEGRLDPAKEAGGDPVSENAGADVRDFLGW